MAEPIPLDLPQRDPCAELNSRLQNAPVEHAEAVLAAYQVLQGLHDRGALDFLRGTLGASDKIIEGLAQASKSPESIRAVRNLVILARALAAIEPEQLQVLIQMANETVVRPAPANSEPPSLWALFKKLGSRDVRRGLAAITSLIERFGKNLTR